MKKTKLIWTGGLWFIFLVILDQVTKYLAVKTLRSQPSVPVLKDILQLEYLENKGAAWGLLENARAVLILVTILLMGLIIYYYLKLPSERKWNLCRFLIIMLGAGAAGNLIDRVIHGYVIDFIYFSLIDFPVFNVADCYVTVSIALFLIVYRKEVWAWIRSES